MKVAPGGLGTVSPYLPFNAIQQGQVALHLAGGSVWRQAPRFVNADDSANEVFVEVLGHLAKDK